MRIALCKRNQFLSVWTHTPIHIHEEIMDGCLKSRARPYNRLASGGRAGNDSGLTEEETTMDLPLIAQVAAAVSSIGMAALCVMEWKDIWRGLGQNRVRAARCYENSLGMPRQGYASMAQWMKRSGLLILRTHGFWRGTFFLAMVILLMASLGLLHLDINSIPLSLMAIYLFIEAIGRGQHEVSDRLSQLEKQVGRHILHEDRRGAP